MNEYFYSETFSKIDFTIAKIIKGEYDNCTFSNCIFENVHASNIQFVECEFIDCNFSNAIVKNTAFRDVRFSNCKMIGVKFNEVDPFLLQFSFKDCQLNYASFYQLKIPNTKFDKCNLEEVDFTESNLNSAILSNCNLKNTIFEHTNLEKVDFRTAMSFQFNPEENQLKGAKFNKENVYGLLSKYKLIIE